MTTAAKSTFGLWFKRILKGLGVLLLVLVLFAVGVATVIYIKRDQIYQMAVSEFNRTQPGTLKIDSILPDFFNNFPYISIDLKNTSIYSAEDKENPVVFIEDFFVGFNVRKLIQGKFEIKSILIKGGNINLIKDEKGLLNILGTFDTSPPEEAQADKENAPISFNLSELKIKETSVSMNDLYSHQVYDFYFEKAKGKLKYSAEKIALDWDVDGFLHELSINGDRLLWDKKVIVDVDLDYVTDSKLLTIRSGGVGLNEAFFDMQGSVDLTEEVNMDLTFDGRKSDFGLFASFAPENISSYLKSYYNSGDIFVNGKIVGSAGKGSTPKINVEFGCKNAYFINQPTNTRMDNVEFTGFFTNGSEQNLRTSEIRIQNFNAEPEQSVFRSSFHIVNFEDPYINLDFRATVDLASLFEFFGVSNVQQINGRIIADVQYNELVDLSDEGASFKRIKESQSSQLSIRDLAFILPGKDLPIEQVNGDLSLVRGDLRVDSLRARVGTSNVSFSGGLKNIPELIHRIDSSFHMDLKLKSDRLNLAELELFAYQPDTSYVVKSTENIYDLHFEAEVSSSIKQIYEFDILPDFDMMITHLEASMDKFPHRLHDFDVHLVCKEDDLRLKRFSGEIDNSGFKLAGQLKNFKYLFDSTNKKEVPLEVQWQSDVFRLKDFFTYDDTLRLPEEYQDEWIKNFKLDAKVSASNEEWRSLSWNEGLNLSIRNLQGLFTFHQLPIRGGRMELTHFNDSTRVNRFEMQVGRSDLSATGFFAKGDDQRGDRKYLNLRSNRMDVDELIKKKATASSSPANKEERNHEADLNIFEWDFPNLTLDLAVNELVNGGVSYYNLNGKVRTTEDKKLFLEPLSIRIPAGDVSIRGYLNGLNPDSLYFESRLSLKQIDIEKLMLKMDDGESDYQLSDNFRGIMDAEIDLRVYLHPDLTPIVKTANARVNAKVSEGRLINFTPLAAMGRFFGDANLNDIRFDNLDNEFTLENSTISFPRMEIASTIGFMFIAGQQSLDSRMDYTVEVPLRLVRSASWNALTSGFRRDRETRDADDKAIQSSADRRRSTLVPIRITGDSENLDVRTLRR
ncbi:MAG: AsmA family protein [Cyclobacteriaceae bacterium]|nr:AsmA family protein [Cyclobacteriaceae bacterium]MCH8514859.1 AsmA family protein [Cyclobacteriaceae bacterium]